MLQGCLYCLLSEVLCVCNAERFLDISVISEGGYFKAHLIFPMEYPQRPPKMKFVSDMWHPNGECFDLYRLLQGSVECMCVYYVYILVIRIHKCILITSACFFFVFSPFSFFCLLFCHGTLFIGLHRTKLCPSALSGHDALE